MPNLAQTFFDHAKASPGAPALVVDDQVVSYGDLADMAGRVAGWLCQQVSAPDRPARVGILAARSLPTYTGILGACCAGATFVPLNPRQPAARLSAIITRAGVDAVVADERGRRLLGDLPLAGRPVLLPSHEPVLGAPLPYAPAPLPEDSPAYILFTSGTTGTPKGVVIPVGAVGHMLYCVQDRYRLGSQDRVAQFFETSFDASILEMFCAWSAGASLHVLPESQLLVPTGFIRRQELTVWCGVPSVITLLSRLNQLAAGSLPTLRLTCFGGEGLSLSAVRHWQAAAPNALIDNQYGPTEAAVACTAQKFTEPPVLSPGRDTLAIGTPFPGSLVDVVDEHGRFLPDGRTGELAIAGPQLATGYLDAPELTARRFPTLTHPRHGTMRWYLTGDLGMRDAAGILHHLGRTDNQVKILGHRVELEEIDAHLREICHTDQAAAVAWPMVDGHATGVVAFVAGGGGISTETARQSLASRVPPYMVPRDIRFVATVPLSANGKIDRKALVAILEQGGGQ